MCCDLLATCLCSVGALSIVTKFTMARLTVGLFKGFGALGHDVYQMKITLLDIKPAVWRRVLLPSNLTLPQFHHVLQTVMGWRNRHPHQFDDGRALYGVHDPQWRFDKVIDERGIPLTKLFDHGKKIVHYEYDFGDGWEHEILLERKFKPRDNTPLPYCLKGQGACPPEGCGGVWGYERLKEINADPAHEEHAQAQALLGAKFNPKRFDCAAVNESLAFASFAKTG